MKKLITLVFALAIIVGGFAQTQRTVLFEMFSGENCPPCAGTTPYVYYCVDNNPSEVQLIHYMSPVPTTGMLCQEDAADDNTRFSYYAGNQWSTPWGQQDGAMWDSTLLTNWGNDPVTWCANLNTGAPASTYLNAEYTVPAYFNMAVWDTFTSGATDSFYASVTITCFDTTGNDTFTMITPKLQFALVENLNYVAEIGNNGETFFGNVVRHMYPSASGTALPTSWANGQTATYTFKGKLPAYIRDKTQLNFIAFIQDNSTLKVMQSAGTLPFTFNTDIANGGIQGNFANCNSAQYTPSVVLANVGSTVITSCSIIVSLDNAIIDTVPWSGNLAVGATTVVSLSPINISAGTHTIRVNLSKPNNITDPNPANNTAGLSLEIADSAAVTPLSQGFENVVQGGQGWVATTGQASVFQRTLNDSAGIAEPWIIYTADHDSTWRVVSTAGDNSSHSLMLDWYDNEFSAGDPEFITAVDYLFSPSFSLGNVPHAVVTFSRAYQQIDWSQAEQGGTPSTDSLFIDVSTDCGNTWTNVYAQNGSGLASVPVYAWTGQTNPPVFVPTAAQWATDSADLTPFVNNPDVMLSFRASTAGTGSDGNNLYLDNINILAPYPAGIVTPSANVTSLEIYPNPTQDQVSLNVQLTQATEIVYHIVDMEGNDVSAYYHQQALPGQNTYSLSTASMASGTYLLQIVAGGERSSKLISVIR